ncbi:hypothetical protein AeRB84_020742 [Aphanomyces euteiches]|nr:hypothetical protein AeRB84_020742 [Aphanomyces euteiches]
MATLLQLKAQNDSRLAVEKNLIDRKRNVLVLMLHYCVETGYLQTAEKLQQEAGVALSKFEVVDNIDLLRIVQEFEDFYEMKFGKKPKLVRRTSGDEEKAKASQFNEKKIAMDKRNKRNSYTSPNMPTEARVENNAALKAVQNTIGSTAAVSTTKAGVPEDIASLEPTVVPVSGQKAATRAPTKAKKGAEAKPEEDHEESVEERLLKPLPFMHDSELRPLAETITREIFQKNPNVHWDNVVGLTDAKRLLKEAVVMPSKYPQLFKGLLSPWCGILLYGPPGNGKTMLAKAVATECKTTFFNISGSSIVSKYRGDSEKLVRMLFDLARYHAPSTIFLDEIDSIMGQRGDNGGGGQEHEASRRMKTELLIQMDGLAKTNEVVFVLAASNLPWELDSAMLRRLEKRVLVGLPSTEARLKMFAELLAPYISSDLDLTECVAKTDGYSGADIKLVAKEACMAPVRRLMTRLEAPDADSNQLTCDSGNWHDLLDKITNEDLVRALEKTKPSAHQFLRKYETNRNLPSSTSQSSIFHDKDGRSPCRFHGQFHGHLKCRFHPCVDGILQFSKDLTIPLANILTMDPTDAAAHVYAVDLQRASQLAHIPYDELVSGMHSSDAKRLEGILVDDNDGKEQETVDAAALKPRRSLVLAMAPSMDMTILQQQPQQPPLESTSVFEGFVVDVKEKPADEAQPLLGVKSVDAMPFVMTAHNMATIPLPAATTPSPTTAYLIQQPHKLVLAVPDVQEDGKVAKKRKSFVRRVSGLPSDVKDITMEAAVVDDLVNVQLAVQKTVPWVAYVILTVALVAVSSQGAAMQALDGVPPLLKMVWRFFGASIVYGGLVVVAARDAAGLPTFTPEIAWQSAVCIVSYSALVATFIWALDHTSVSHAYIFNNAHSLLFVVGKCAMAQPIAPFEAVGAVLGVLGGVITTADTQGVNTAEGSHEPTMAGDLVALSGAIGGVFYLTYAKTLRGTIGVWNFCFCLYMGTWIVLTTCLWLGQVEIEYLSTHPQRGFFGWVHHLDIELVLIFIVTMCGSMGFVSSMKYFSALVVSVTMLLEPIVATVICIALGMAPVPGWLTFVGGLAVLVGTVLVISSSGESHETVDVTEAVVRAPTAAAFDSRLQYKAVEHGSVQ